MRRIAIIGCSGVGKTTLARELARRLELEHIELDGIFHQPSWTPLPRDEFQRRVEARALGARGGWVSCGNYTSSAGCRLQDLADTIVWLDLGRWDHARVIRLRSPREVEELLRAATR